MANKKRGFLDPRASRLKSVLKFFAPILYVPLNLLIIYLPSAIRSNAKLEDLLTKPDAYGFVVALILNSIIATVAFYF